MALACDLIGRLVIAPYEVPIGTVMGVIGSAMFLALLLALYGAFLFRGLGGLIQLGFPWRILISVALISLAGFFMGAFFPEGIRRLGAADKAMIGWAWGANSFATVVGSIMAVIVSINWDFTAVLLLAALSYLAAAWFYGRSGKAGAA